MKHRSEKKRPLRAILLALAGILAAFLLYSIGKVLFYGRGHGDRQSPARVELTWEEAAADGTVSPEEIAVHYAPEIHAAVNVLISESGKGDFRVFCILGG